MIPIINESSLIVYFNLHNMIRTDNLQLLAESIESAIYELNDAEINSGYKESIRSHILNLKDQQNPLRQRVLTGEIDPMEFASMVLYINHTNIYIYICVTRNTLIPIKLSINIYRIQQRWQQRIDVKVMNS